MIFKIEAKLKLPRLIELLSNTPHHIIEQMVFSNIKDNPHPTEELHTKEKILSYLLSDNILNINELQIP